MNNPYISDLKLPTNYIEKVIADIDNDVYSDSIVKLDVNSIKIGTVLGLHAIIKREVKVTSAVLLTLCDIQRAANNIKCNATNISRAIEKCKKLRGAKKIDFFTETFKLSPSIVNRDCEVSYGKTVNGTVTPDVQKEVPKKHESSKRYRDGTTKSHNILKHETAKKHKQIRNTPVIPSTFFTDDSYRQHGQPMSFQQMMFDKEQQLQAEQAEHAASALQKLAEQQKKDEQKRLKDEELAKAKQVALQKLKLHVEQSSKAADIQKGTVTSREQKHEAKSAMYSTWWHPDKITVPQPRRSNLGREDHKTYLKLLQKFTKHLPQNPTPLEMKELSTFKELQMQVMVEQEEFQRYLEDVAFKSHNEYKHIEPCAEKYMKEYLGYERQQVTKYPQYYIQHESVSLTVGKDGPNHSLSHEQTLLRTGLIPKVTRPNICHTTSPKIDTDYATVNGRHPAIESTSHKIVSSLDPNCEDLACKYKCDIVMSLEAITCILDNTAPYDRQWEIPVTIKEHKVKDKDDVECTMKVIYVDDPLPPKSLTVREKNSMYHAICLKTFLQFPTSNHSVDIGGGESKLYQEPVVETEGVQDEMFGITNMNTLETFGTQLYTNRNKDKSDVPKASDVSSTAPAEHTTEITHTSNNDTAMKAEDDTVEESPASPTLSTDICLDFTPQVFIPHDTAADLDLSSDDDGENLLDIDLPQLDGQQDKKGKSKVVSTWADIARSGAVTRRSGRGKKRTDLDAVETPAKCQAKTTKCLRSGRTVSDNSETEVDEAKVKVDEEGEEEIKGSELEEKLKKTTEKMEEEENTDDASGAEDKRLTRHASKRLTENQQNEASPKRPHTSQKSDSTVENSEDCGEQSAVCSQNGEGTLRTSAEDSVPDVSVDHFTMALDDIMQAQKNMLSTSPRKYAHIDAPSDLDPSQKGDLDPSQKGVQSTGGGQPDCHNPTAEWKTLEDWTDYQSPPPNCNKSYDAWNWTDNETKMLLTSTMDGYMTKTKKLGCYFMNFLPKVEYQSHIGYEQVTFSESCDSWVKLAFNHQHKLVRVRMNAFNSVITKVEYLDMQDVIHPQCPFNPVQSMKMLHNVIEKVKSLKLGTYLLGHSPGNTHLHIKRNVNTKKGVYNLHLAYLGFLDSDPETINDKIQWIPIDTSLNTFNHVKHNRIPAMFDPKDITAQQPFVQRGKNNYGKKNKNKKKKQK